MPKVDPTNPNLTDDVPLLGHITQGCTTYCWGRVDKMGVNAEGFDEPSVLAQLGARQERSELSQDWVYTTRTRYSSDGFDSFGDGADGKGYVRAHERFTEVFGVDGAKGVFFVGYNQYGTADILPELVEIGDDVTAGIKNQLVRKVPFDTKEGALAFMNGLQRVLDAVGHHSNNVVEIKPDGKVDVYLEMHTHGAKGGPGLTVADISTCALVDAYIKYPNVEQGIADLISTGDRDDFAKIVRELLYVHALDAIKDPSQDFKHHHLYERLAVSTVKHQATAVVENELRLARELYAGQVLELH